MERTIESTEQGSAMYDIHNEPIVLSKHLLDILFKEDDCSNLLTLYTFYYYTAKWQKTNQPRATLSYVAKGLHWGTDKIKKVKKNLKELNLIEDFVTKNEIGQITGHYIKVNFIWSKTKTNDFSTGGIFPPVVSQDTNALRNSSIIVRPKKLSIKERSFEYLSLAKELSNIVQETKHIEHTRQQIHYWANDIRQLVENNKVSVERIKAGLQYLKEHAGEQYCPVIESGSALKEKFGKLEGQINRKEYKPKEYHRPTIYDDHEIPYHWNEKEKQYISKGGMIWYGQIPQ